MTVRASGILHHPTSLPGRFGVGDLGPAAAFFLQRLAAAGQRVWQILPVHPPAGARSPYDARSTYAGDPLLISPEELVADGLLPAAALAGVEPMEGGRIAFGRAQALKQSLLRTSWQHFRSGASAELRDDLGRFAEGAEQAPWLADWTLFAALHRRFEGRAWSSWPTDLRRRAPAALGAAGRELAEEIAFERYVQFLFDRQWRALRRRAEAVGVRLYGDLPIYVAYDSADVWADQELFELDAEGQPLAVAGVPPDTFSDSGQLWGHPLYRWERHRADGFAWWVRRVASALRRVDLLRLDHFRGFVAYWRVPAGAGSAREGRWARGPGRRLFAALETALGELPLIAEDLGSVTPAVRRLRRELGVPGMRVVQFAFDSEDSEHLPERCPPDTVIYSGTHDNDTTRGWVRVLEGERRQRLDRYLGLSTASADPGETVWRLLAATLGARSELAVVPMQDVLALGSDARTNTPGVADGNWRWRMRTDAFTDELVERLRSLTETSGRWASDAPPGAGGP
ncbi:MAG TPA: 4-alpha-glucanotransferase [Thermoanaerobaculia bacterium]|nr:4-alpha-glucanotransferase [Thermoanaerobaculia bacterium]